VWEEEEKEEEEAEEYEEDEEEGSIAVRILYGGSVTIASYVPLKGEFRIDATTEHPAYGYRQ
jgi:hypothetical protein